MDRGGDTGEDRYPQGTPHTLLWGLENDERGRLPAMGSKVVLSPPAVRES